MGLGQGIAMKDYLSNTKVNWGQVPKIHFSNYGSPVDKLQISTSLSEYR
jgi:hypothetical protein